MVDLRDALHPFVDAAATAPRRPVAEVAERAVEARRRRIRRRSVLAGVAVVLAGSGLILTDPFASPDRSGQVSVADQPEPGATAPTSPTTPTTPTAPHSSTPPGSTAPDSSPSTTAPATTSPMASTPGTTASTAPPPEGGPLVSLVDGVVATSTTTSSWEDGRCVEVRVENTTAAPVEWRVRYDLGGTIATLWSAVADDRGGGIVELTGEDGYNRRLGPGASTTFGTCVDT